MMNTKLLVVVMENKYDKLFEFSPN